MTELRLAEFNSADPDRIREVLTECLDVPRWVESVLAGRPYPDLDSVLGTAEITLRPGEIHRAMRAHPRIGDRKGDDWSRSEQSGVDDHAAAEFREANAAYERRFGHVYLVCASGRSGEDLLADLESRLGNDPDTELAVAGRELVEIAKLRLGKAVHP